MAEAEFQVEAGRVGRVAEVFAELRASGKSSEEIFVTVYQDLKQLARKMVGNARAGDSMHATRLLSDVWVRMFGKPAADFEWTSGQHFFSYVARAMHNLLVDHARRRKAQVRGGGHVESLDRLMLSGFEAAPDLIGGSEWFYKRGDQSLMLDDALRRLEQHNKRQADIVYLHLYYLRIDDVSDDSNAPGRSQIVQQIAAALDVSPSTVTKDFAKAKARLAFYLSSVE
jgi:RNA polymerase sigma factor (sigma-70 family)